ncbi:MAG: HepT-like ribonuclease domain-containing protein [Tunicatimonas sp.]
MNERILKWLYDISDAIDEIESYFLNFPKDFGAYQSNTLLKRAVERDLEIIGEAVNRIIREDPTFPISSAKRIVGLRNQIIHAYDSISDENVWAIVLKHIPILKHEVTSLIDQAK